MVTAWAAAKEVKVGREGGRERGQQKGGGRAKPACLSVCLDRARPSLPPAWPCIGWLCWGCAALVQRRVSSGLLSCGESYRGLDLGCGLGSVLLMMCWNFPR